MYLSSAGLIFGSQDLKALSHTDNISSYSFLNDLLVSFLTLLLIYSRLLVIIVARTTAVRGTRK